MAMKLITLFFLLPLCASAQLVPVVLEWNYPTNELSTNLTFVMYKGTNVTQSMSTWEPITNIIGTNLSVELSLLPGEYYFAMKAKNMWGESIFSNSISTPPAPRSVSVKVIRLK